jgi:hypothetical protein
MSPPMFCVSRGNTVRASLVQPNRTTTLRASRLWVITQLHHLKHRHLDPNQPALARRLIRLEAPRLALIEFVSHFLALRDNHVTA